MQRRRIRHSEEEWRVVYEGVDPCYAVEALIPEHLMANITVRCEFRLRTRGTEFGWDSKLEKCVASDELSLPSDLLVCSTKQVESTSRPRQHLKRAIQTDSLVQTDGQNFLAVGRGRHYV